MFIDIEVLQSLTILYVEDEKSLQHDVKENILPFVKNVLTADNGKEGLEIFKTNENDIDLIVSDILMPRMNGIEMVDAIRKINYEIPIIYTTAFNDNEYLQSTTEQSIDGYILKPIDIEKLLTSIDKASIKIKNKNLKNKLIALNKNLEFEVLKKTEELVLLNKELETKNQELHRQLCTDSLTLLPNRKALMKDLEAAKNPIVAIIDIDAFRNINDLYGIKTGNNVLIEVASLLRSMEKNMDCRFYRIGSDEFVLLKDTAFIQDHCKTFIKYIVSTINQNPLCGGENCLDIYIDATIGVSYRCENCIEKADMALKKAKKNKLSYLIYSNEDDLEEEYKNDVKWTKLVKEAIINDQILPFFQPIVDEQANIIKYESLMRLIKDNNAFSPTLFLDIAKKVKFYPALTRIMIKKSFEQAQQSGISVSINLSIQDITDGAMINFIKENFIQYNVSNSIIFEITESESIRDYEEIDQFISTTKALGAKIAIDDFGSGYSNFSYLLKLKPDFIKIDGSLIREIDIDKNAYIITKNIVKFAQELGIKTIAEYVHSKAIFKILKKLNIDAYQGFYFSKPKKEIA